MNQWVSFCPLPRRAASRKQAPTYDYAHDDKEKNTDYDVGDK